MQERILALAIAKALAFSPLAMVPQIGHAQNVDLGNLGDRGFQIDGNDAGDLAGRSVSGAGDVNGDGLADLIIGASYADPDGKSEAGETYVVFGKASNMTIELVNLGDGGFRIDGSAPYDNSGYSVSGAGDVNGDGLADLIIGSPEDFDGNDDRSGRSYVVFGKASSTPIDLDNLGSDGFRIDGIDANDRSGRSVAGAGDVNGDGLADLIVGAWFADPGGENSAGESYVVFGKASSSTVDLANLGSGGFRIEGIDADDLSGHSVSGAGDVNGDGLADLIIGAYGADPGGNSYAGESYVVFGKASSSTVDLENLSSGGFRINGIDSSDLSGRSVAGAGDVNGDGLADLIVGATGARIDQGETYLVFGKVGSAPVNLANLGAGGFRIDGSSISDRSGRSVSGAGDVNGDGRADLVIGAFTADPGFVTNAGESYVVFGKADNTLVELANLGAGGFRMTGVDPDDFSGFSVSGAGDVNGDGLADLIIGARYASTDTFNAGESYLVFSTAAPPSSAVYRVRSRNGDAPRMAVGVSGDGSNDSTPDARLWIDFADGEDPLELASTETVTLTRSNGGFPAAAAGVSWRLQTTRQNWTSAEVTVRYVDQELFDCSEARFELVFSPTGSAPFTPLSSQINPRNNTITAVITEPGFIYIGQSGLFADRFQSPPC
jgi:hypothetical protein